METMQTTAATPTTIPRTVSRLRIVDAQSTSRNAHALEEIHAKFIKLSRQASQSKQPGDEALSYR